VEIKKINLFGDVATLVTPIRLILGWQFCSAFLRRMLNAPEKLDPTSPAYVGHAFNHFLPHSLFIKPFIKYLIIHPEILYYFLVTFTIIEGLVGIGLLLGFFTRIAALGATLLALGILLGSGWLGSTCVDEWQIGITGIGIGLVVLSLGAGVFSLDQLFFKNRQSKFLQYISSGDLNLRGKQIKLLALSFSFIAMFITLFTYQALHNGLYGKLYNLSKKPKLEIANPLLEKNGTLRLTLYRTDGPDTYGAFITKILLINKDNKLIKVFDLNNKDLGKDQIKNYYFNKVAPNNNSLVVPLGAKATITLLAQNGTKPENGIYKVEVIDISGLQWSKTFTVN